MPYQHLGEGFQALQVRNVNGSFYQYDAGGGQLLCALLWSLPDYDGPTRSSLRRTRDNPEDRMAIQDVGVDLWENVEHFRELSRFYRKTGKVEFVTANLNKATARNYDNVSDLFLESSWPWVNFMAHDSSQGTAWEFADRYSQVMVLVDVNGMVRYMGPVGGFLPLMLLEEELPQAQANQQEIAFANAASGLPQGSDKATGGFLSNLLTGGAKSQPQPTEAAAPTVQPEPVETKSTTSTTSGELESDPQAQQMLEAARLKKRISARGALNIYDEVISRFPDTKEAELSRMHIKSICRRDSRMKKERTKQGKYTGFE